MSEITSENRTGYAPWAKSSQDYLLEARLLELYAVLVSYDNHQHLSNLTSENSHAFEGNVYWMTLALALDRVSGWCSDMAEKYFRDHDVKAARHHAEAVIKIFDYIGCPHSGRAHQILGFLDFQENDWERGIEHIEQAADVFVFHNYLPLLRELVLYLNGQMDAMKPRPEAYDKLKFVHDKISQALHQTGDA